MADPKKQDKPKDIEATESWDDFRKFASNLMQATPDDLKDAEGRQELKDKYKQTKA
ncbi:hypothetical protein [Sphaerothrix gracilis]|uniref:hypothetical protein n=1 Tax=Sphaerothrix gracilis TaxID=3151835 RepID=UPI0031FD4430